MAYHEVGHALVATYSEHADPVHKISIIPRGRAALGLYAAAPDGRPVPAEPLGADRPNPRPAGRAGRRGAGLRRGEHRRRERSRTRHRLRPADDLPLRHERIGRPGPLRPKAKPAPADPPAGRHVQRDCSEQTAREIDLEVKQLLSEGYESAKHILTLHRDQLDLVAQELLKRETLDQQASTLCGRQPAPDAVPRSSAPRPPRKGSQVISGKGWRFPHAKHRRGDGQYPGASNPWRLDTQTSNR